MRVDVLQIGETGLETWMSQRHSAMELTSHVTPIHKDTKVS